MYLNKNRNSNRSVIFSSTVNNCNSNNNNNNKCNCNKCSNNNSKCNNSSNCNTYCGKIVQSGDCFEIVKVDSCCDTSVNVKDVCYVTMFEVVIRCTCRTQISWFLQGLKMRCIKVLAESLQYSDNCQSFFLKFITNNSDETQKYIDGLGCNVCLVSNDQVLLVSLPCCSNSDLTNALCLVEKSGYTVYSVLSTTMQNRWILDTSDNASVAALLRPEEQKRTSVCDFSAKNQCCSS